MDNNKRIIYLISGVVLIGLGFFILCYSANSRNNTKSNIKEEATTEDSSEDKTTESGPNISTEKIEPKYNEDVVENDEDDNLDYVDALYKDFTIEEYSFDDNANLKSRKDCIIHIDLPDKLKSGYEMKDTIEEGYENSELELYLPETDAYITYNATFYLEDDKDLDNDEYYQELKERVKTKTNTLKTEVDTWHEITVNSSKEYVTDIKPINISGFDGYYYMIKDQPIKSYSPNPSDVEDLTWNVYYVYLDVGLENNYLEIQFNYSYNNDLPAYPEIPEDEIWQILNSKITVEKE